MEPIASPHILCLTGPTAAGKTQVALELARHHGFDIVSVDSALVYRGLDIGSGKPDKATLVEIPHRLVDIRDPSKPYSAAEFRADATQAVADILAAGRRPLLVGGTMLYFKVLRDGLASMPAANPAVRQRILDLAARNGWHAVHERLAAVDPDAAARIHPNDPQRLSRALEIWETTGTTMTDLHRREQAGGNTLPPHMANLVFVAVHPHERATLHARIATRFLQMLDAGLVAEVDALYRRGDLSRDLPAIRSVGYRQVWDYLEGRYDYQAMVDKGIAATRQLAKRQLTWLRSWPDLHRIEAESGIESENIVNKCLNILANAAIN